MRSPRVENVHVLNKTVAPPPPLLGGDPMRRAAGPPGSVPRVAGALGAATFESGMVFAFLYS